jgi:RNA recognition motif-containing protein
MVKYNLYFKNLPSDSNEEELKDFFSQFGEIRSLRLMRKKVTAKEDESKEAVYGESLGFGFVSFVTIESAIRARHECKTKLFKGRYLIVN